MRILYFNHDNCNPSGGIRTMYRHVEILRKNGFNAYIVHGENGFNISWFQHNCPILYYKDNDFRLQDDDFCILPENHLDVIKYVKKYKVKTIIFCQSIFYIFRGFAYSKDWKKRKYDAIICGSEYIKKCLATNMNIENSIVVPYSIDNKIFYPRRKKKQICFMPRKMPKEAKFILRGFKAIYPEFDSFNWVEIDNFTEKEVATTLGESAIFLSLSKHEGMGIPPLEAMASKCVVVGYRGGGGQEYSNHGNGLWCKDGDLLECIHKIAQAIQIYLCNPTKNSVVTKGLETLKNYSISKMESALLLFWEEMAKLN